MNYRRGLLSRLKASDKVAVTLLRGGDSRYATDEMRDSFALLRERAQQMGLVILPVDALTVGAGELVVLGWLVAWQRDRLEPALDEWRVTLAEVQNCAQLLDKEGLRLDYHHLVRVKGKDGRSALDESKQTRSSSNIAPHPNADRPLRSKILSEIAERGSMRMCELQELGASRQTVTNLVRRGFLTRLSYGTYGVCNRILK